uniref:Uncharacterized protein n=1 Tax=Arundo donax TaxID=35708 RepID=A0A0A9HD00_ARUDO
MLQLAVLHVVKISMTRNSKHF